METEKTVLTPRDVADILGVSVRLVYRQLRKGVIPHVKCGDLYLISRKALDEWLAGERQPVGTGK